MPPVRCHVGLGANIGNPQQQLENAVAALAALDDCRLVAVSPLYRSAPLGPRDQPDFLNAVAALDTALPAAALLDALLAIENAAGRVRGRRWGPRVLDLDLLLYGDACFHEPRLTVPHPGIAGRTFVLLPLVDLCGSGYRLPGGEELGTLVAACPGPAPVRLAWSLEGPAGRERQ
jgi:2-amino-4-hydroxy-6-hydroxymethyldihydropteridine diphosphokinase